MGTTTVHGAASPALDALAWQGPVTQIIDFTSSEPGGPTIGDRHINDTTGTSSGTSQAVTEDHIYEWNGSNWTDLTPAVGWLVYDEDTNLLMFYDVGGDWQTFLYGGESSELLLTVDLIGTDDTDGTGSVAGAVEVVGGNASAYSLVRVWISTSNWGAPVARTDFSVTAGVEMHEHLAEADYDVITASDGTFSMNINEGGAGTVYVMAEVAGRIYSSGAIAITDP